MPSPKLSVPLPLTPKARARARDLLGLGDSRRVLAALGEGDPLGIAERIHHGLRRGAWLVDPQELRRSALARIACEASSWRGRPRIEVWLDAQIEAARAELVESGPYRRFHALPFDVRDLFCRALLDGEDPQALARARCGDYSRFGRTVLQGLEALLDAGEPARRGARVPGTTGFAGVESREVQPRSVTPGDVVRPSGVASS